MDRREFLRGATGTLLVLPLGVFLIGCNDDDDTNGRTSTTNPTQPDNTPPDAPPRVEGGNVVYTSNVVNLHAHSFSVAAAAFGSPPANGLTGDTTDAQLHSHQLTITEADLRRADDGEVVKVDTTSNVGHVHTFTIVKVT